MFEYKLYTRIYFHSTCSPSLSPFPLNNFHAHIYIIVQILSTPLDTNTKVPAKYYPQSRYNTREGIIEELGIPSFARSTLLPAPLIKILNLKPIPKKSVAGKPYGFYRNTLTLCNGELAEGIS